MKVLLVDGSFRNFREERYRSNGLWRWLFHRFIFFGNRLCLGTESSRMSRVRPAFSFFGRIHRHANTFTPPRKSLHIGVWSESHACHHGLRFRVYMGWQCIWAARTRSHQWCIRPDETFFTCHGGMYARSSLKKAETLNSSAMISCWSFCFPTHPGLGSFFMA